jgi:signal transduction histidine kinase
MRARALAIGATISVERATGGGTRIIVALPDRAEPA